MKVERESEVARSCLIPSDPMDCSPPGSSIHGIFQARVLEWGAVAFSEGLRAYSKQFSSGGSLLPVETIRKACQSLFLNLSENWEFSDFTVWQIYTLNY